MLGGEDGAEANRKRPLLDDPNRSPSRGDLLRPFGRLSEGVEVFLPIAVKGNAELDTQQLGGMTRGSRLAALRLVSPTAFCPVPAQLVNLAKAREARRAA
jgi:hypothetical protein